MCVCVCVCVCVLCVCVVCVCVLSRPYLSLYLLKRLVGKNNKMFNIIKIKAEKQCYFDTPEKQQENA